MKQLIAVSSILVLSILALTCGGGPAVEETAAGLPAGPHPVVIIAIDGLRADALGSYGGDVATPSFDALAAESVRFDSAWAQAPEMMPSLAALLSGMYPTSNGLRAPGDQLQPAAETVAEVLGGAGLATAAFIEGAPGGADFGLAQGFGSFQVVERPGAEGVLWMTDHAEEDFLLVMAGWGSRALDEADLLLDEEEAIDPDRVTEVLASRGGEDPKLFDETELARVSDWYAARVLVMDAFIGDFMTAFETAGLDERATLVVLGSNGLALQEHGDLFGETVYAPVTRVPLFIRFPGGARSRTVDEVVELLDVMPTVVELNGLEPPGSVQGSSLVGLIEGTSTPPYVAFGETPNGAAQSFVALAGYRAVATGDDGKVELFHTAADALELDDLAESEPDKLAKLSNDLDAWTKMVAATSLDPELRTDAELDDETLKQLKSLGYIQ
jgi:arylsulfatase A-like enzyme